MIWNPLTFKFIGVALIGVLIAGGVQQIRIYKLKSQLADAQAKVSALDAQIAVIEDANSTCAVHVKTQNLAIQALKLEQKQREQEAAKRIAAAEKRAAQVDAKAQTLRERPMLVLNDTCASLEALLDEAIAERK